MALNVDFKMIMGKITIENPKYKTTADGEEYIRDERGSLIEDGYSKFTIDICHCNALAAFISTWKDEKGTHKDLWSFFMDTAHAKRMMKHNGKVFENDRVVKVRMNIAYAEVKSMIPIMVKSGYKTELYYKPIKPKL